MFTIRPDGSNRTDLTRVDDDLVAVQPTWSPDATRLAWTEVDHMKEVPEAAVVTAGPQGEDPDRLASGTAPFYYSWSSTSRLAFLAPGTQGGIDLGVVDEDTIRILDNGQPFYFDWSPSGAELLTHRSGVTVSSLGLDESSTVLVETGALFQAPQWSSSGDLHVYAIGEPPPIGGIQASLAQSEFQELVVARTDGEILHRIMEFRGVATFELNQESELLAHSVTTDRNTFNFGPLEVTRLSSGETETISEDPVVAFQWSPSGDRLLYLQANDRDDHPTFQWMVWDGNTSTAYAQVTPTVPFTSSYLPFWDQYAHSHRLWAPDGSAFAYPAVDEKGDPAVWVQVIDNGTQPVRVTQGDVVFWSPR